MTPPFDAEAAPQGCNSVPKRCKPHHPAVSSLLLWFERGFKASGPVPRVHTIIANPLSNQILNQGLQSTEFSSKEFAGMENIIQRWYRYVGNITHIWIYIDTCVHLSRYTPLHITCAVPCPMNINHHHVHESIRICLLLPPRNTPSNSLPAQVRKERPHGL